MKKQTITLSILFMSVLIALSSCKKEKVDIIPDIRVRILGIWKFIQFAGDENENDRIDSSEIKKIGPNEHLTFIVNNDGTASFKSVNYDRNTVSETPYLWHMENDSMLILNRNDGYKETQAVRVNVDYINKKMELYYAKGVFDSLANSAPMWLFFEEV